MMRQTLYPLMLVLAGLTAASEQDVSQAERLFHEGLLFDALPLLEGAVDSCKETPDLAGQLKIRLAECYLKCGKESLTILKLEPCIEEFNDPHPLLLLGVASRRCGEYEKACSYLTQYLKRGGKLQEEAQLELGIASFHLGRYGRAKEELLPLRSEPLALIYLGRCEMRKGNLLSATERFRTAKEAVSSGSPLLFELHFLEGKAEYRLGNYTKAAEALEQALPQKGLSAPWRAEALQLLGECCLKIASASSPHYFDRAGAFFKEAEKSAPSDALRLAIGRCCLAKGRELNDEEALQEAEALLADEPSFFTAESKAQALLLRAEAAGSYRERERLYKKLTEKENEATPFYSKGWYLRGLNHYKEGELLRKGGEEAEARGCFEEAASAWEQALLNEGEGSFAATLLKNRAKALAAVGSGEALEKAFVLLDPLIHGETEEEGELYYLHALAAAKLLREDTAIRSLKLGLERCPGGKEAADSLFLLGTLYYKREKYPDAEACFSQLALDRPETPLAPEALYWSAESVEKQGAGREKAQRLREKLAADYPGSPLAAEAFFRCYPLNRYLQGEQKALQHLDRLVKEFPESPFAIYGWYLIGLDCKRDRKSEEGKWLRKKNLTAAIDAFQKAETLYDALQPEEQQLAATSCQATIERGMANLAIAESSQGAKKQIYLEYAEEVFKKLLQRLERERLPAAPLKEEALFGLAKIYLKQGDEPLAERHFSLLLAQLKEAKISRGYYLSRTWYELGMLAMGRQEHALARDCFGRAEEAAKGRLLSTDQELDLRIQKSLCCLRLREADEAMRLLSDIINEDAVSALRIKAMFLRAEIYEHQGRRELAMRQLEAAAKKGGLWGKKAEEKLNGYF